MPAEEFVVVVDGQDRALGEMEKLRAHREGVLHRAVSVVITDSEGRHLLQQRAAGKYHGGRLWSNTCCGHPRPGESPADAAARRLLEEMGLTCDLRRVATFAYRAEVGDLIEHEIDHVFTGVSEVEPHPNPDEVMAWRAAGPVELSQDLEDHPERYTPWLPLVLQALRDAATSGR